MDAQEIINFIANAEKKTPVKVYVNLTEDVDFGSAKVFGTRLSQIVFGDWEDLAPILEANADKIVDCEIEHDRRNSAVPLLDLKNIKARIEPGAIIRDKVTIGEGAVIMMGTVLGGRATVGDHCHIGAGAVLAGVVEPASATPVIVEDGVLIGANAVVIEGVHIGKNAVVAAGAIVIEDVPEHAVVGTAALPEKDGPPRGAAPTHCTRRGRRPRRPVPQVL